MEAKKTFYTSFAKKELASEMLIYNDEKLQKKN
jgi:hypothetical protein